MRLIYIAATTALFLMAGAATSASAQVFDYQLCGANEDCTAQGGSFGAVIYADESGQYTYEIDSSGNLVQATADIPDMSPGDGRWEPSVYAFWSNRADVLEGNATGFGVVAGTVALYGGAASLTGVGLPAGGTALLGAGALGLLGTIAQHNANQAREKAQKELEDRIKELEAQSAK